MPRFRLLCLNVVLLVSLAGCFPLSALDVGLLVLSMPGGVGTGKTNLTGYTIGPVSSENFPDLLLKAIPDSEGEVNLFGRVQWTGLTNIKQSRFSILQTVAAFTNTDILSLWWYEEDEQYRILLRLPYSDIQSVSFEKSGFGATMKLCHNVGELLLEDQKYSIGQSTRLNFLNQNGMLEDAIKTEEAFGFLEDKIKPQEGLNSTPKPCEGDQQPAVEYQGFGEDALLMQRQSRDKE